MFVYTASENCEYHGGAPAGKIGLAWCSISDSRVAAPGTLPDLTRSARPPRLDGSGKVWITYLEPLAPAKAAWLAGSSIHFMNSTAAATCLASAGMPMPSGLPRLEPTPLAPGVGMYFIWPTTLDSDGTW